MYNLILYLLVICPFQIHLFKIQCYHWSGYLFLQFSNNWFFSKKLQEKCLPFLYLFFFVFNFKNSILPFFLSVTSFLRAQFVRCLFAVFLDYDYLSSAVMLCVVLISPMYIQASCMDKDVNFLTQYHELFAVALLTFNGIVKWVP